MGRCSVCSSAIIEYKMGFHLWALRRVEFIYFLDGVKRMKYSFQQIEEKWQKNWQETGLYETDTSTKKPKFYALEQFPYPSGEGLHMGHMRVYSIGDVVSRFWRMQGYRVLHPMGADSFGLPAENAAIHRGVNPREYTLGNMGTFTTEQRRMGISYDWDRYISTCLPEYYQFNQWFFLLFYEKGLAYRKKAFVNWCPTCSTVLANEQVKDGFCWRCDTQVTKKDLKQWFVRITQYAEKLLEGLDRLPKWPERVKTMQRNWIGKSEGVLVDFVYGDQKISVFTTRVDTLYGVTYIVLAPEHPLVPKLIKGRGNEHAICQFIDELKGKKEIERLSSDGDKVGYATGAFAIHPLTGEKVPIWIADYVLMDYGTGAVMGVPAHDDRDFQFATKYQLPIKVVIQSEDESLQGAYTGEGPLVQSSSFDGMNNVKSIPLFIKELEQKKLGRGETNYRLRDWLISRQRYWGTPIPIIYCDTCGTVPVPKDQLPVLLPEDIVFTGKENPLTTSESFVTTVCPACGGEARRETDTMDTFFDSSWYYLRFADPHNKEVPFDPDQANEWLPVNEYIGGIEHAVLHLLYSRFFTKVLHDEGLLAVDEPFVSLLPQGMVLKDGFKMSKSKGNVISSLDIIDRYGADTARLFILFAAPPDRDLDWNDAGVEGSFRFLKRVWRLIVENQDIFAQNIPAQEHGKDSKALYYQLHHTIQRVTIDIAERNQFNTAVSSIMELVNVLQKYPSDADQGIFRKSLETLLLLLAPFAPHITEELWHMIGKTESVHKMTWPSYDPEALVLDEIELVVQINGKLRGKVVVAKDTSREEVEQVALNNAKIQKLIEGKSVRKVIIVPNRLINIVIG